MLTAKLRGRGDWDLALFDARTRRQLGASSSFGGSERVDAVVARATRVVAQACRRTGTRSTARLSFALTRAKVKTKPDHPSQMLRVSLVRPDDVARLERLGLDVTHNITPSYADVAVYSAMEKLRLVRNGFTFTVRIADMEAADLVARRQEARALPTGRALPSGRTTYRTLAEYSEDLKKLVDTYPGLVRRLEIGRSLEDRPIEGVELAKDVARVDDGRPTLAVMGVHHAREWPSGEMPMEFAIDLAKNYGADPRVTALLDQVRVVILPVINPDGFNVSRSAGPTPFDDNSAATLPLIVSDGASYKRKNCRAFTPGEQSAPCASRQAGAGVDLNRNYGAYWGGVGSDSNPAVQNYRGTAPYSEPEAEAVHKLSQTRNIVTLITHHTFTSGGTWLRQPGFCMWGEPGCSESEDLVPDEAGMKELGDAMGAASGWASQLGWAIGEITGATEDWNYFAASAYGYTPEQRGPNFHPNFAQAVIAEYTGEGAEGAAGGVRGALLRAGEQAANRTWHSVLTGRARPGYTLRIRKSFETPTSQEGVVVKDTLEFSLRVPASGTYTWDLNPSTRPLAPAPESYTLTCEDPAGAVLDTRQVVLARGASFTADLPCGGRLGGSGGGATGGGSTTNPSRPTTARIRAFSLRARSVERRKRFSVRIDVANGELVKPVIRLLRGKRTVYQAKPASLKGSARVTLRRRARLRPGTHTLTLTARDRLGRKVTAKRRVRVKR